jgi:hypothetical protein
MLLRSIKQASSIRFIVLYAGSEALMCLADPTQGYLRAYVLMHEEGKVFLEDGKKVHLSTSHMMHCINYGTYPWS